jgi:hypothetical protein
MMLGRGGRPQSHAETNLGYVGYQVISEGDRDIMFLTGALSKADAIWDEPSAARFVDRLGTMGRVIRYDMRGSGVSDPIPGKNINSPVTTKFEVCTPSSPAQRQGADRVIRRSVSGTGRAVDQEGDHEPHRSDDTRSEQQPGHDPPNLRKRSHLPLSWKILALGSEGEGNLSGEGCTIRTDVRYGVWVMGAIPPGLDQMEPGLVLAASSSRSSMKS